MGYTDSATRRTSARSKRDNEISTFLSQLTRYRSLVVPACIQAIPAITGSRLYEMVREYPLRQGKGLRPALCLATCQACGGKLRQALNSAVALEFFHNAFLVHDDVEDGSIYRRGEPTLLRKYGPAVAVNVGDAMQVLAMRPLLKNLETIGLEKTLNVFYEIERMARLSVEGQALELEWVRANRWDFSEQDYVKMTAKKSCWYTCIAPCRIGALIAGNPHLSPNAFNGFGFFMGIAFQIQDDVLNLVGAEALYGKEAAGDIWEGKWTIMLMHLLSTVSRKERAQIVRILSKPRPAKTEEEVDYVLGLMKKYGSIEHGKATALHYARQAQVIFERRLGILPESPHKDFLRDMIMYVIEREL